MLWIMATAEFRCLERIYFYGSKGHNPGQLQYPCYNAVDSSDQVYVTDYSNDGGISVFSGDGHFIKRINCICHLHCSR